MNKTDITESTDVLPQAEITKINDNEYNIDVTRCHGLEMKTGDITDLIPGPTTFTGFTRGRVQTAMEQVLAEAGGSLPIGGKLLLHLNSTLPGAILDIAISAKEEGVFQATVSTTAGVVTEVIVTGAVAGTPFAPFAQLAGIVSGSLVNYSIDWAWKKVTKGGDDVHEEGIDMLPLSPQTVTLNMSTGILISDLPLETNLKVVDSLQQQGHIITQLEGSDGIKFTNMQDSPKAEVLYHDDGSPAVIHDPDNNWSVEYKEDASGVVYIGTGDNQQEMPFKPNDEIVIGYQSNSNFGVSVTNFKANTPPNKNTESAPPQQTDHQDSNTSEQTTQIPHNYTIQRGDTLSELAEANNTTVENILIFNLEIDNPDLIKAGDEIVIPPEGWEFPLSRPMTDADGNPILLASNDDSFAERLLKKIQSEVSTSDEEQPQTELSENTEYWVNPTFTDYLKILVPTYGLYCGPGWFAGERTSRDYTPTSEDSEVSGADEVDECCRTHDLAYEAAENQPNEAALMHEADIQLLENLTSLPPESIDDLGVHGALYLPLMVVLFETKVVLYDVTHPDEDSSDLSQEDVVTQLADRLNITLEQAETRLQQLQNPDLLIPSDKSLSYDPDETEQISVNEEESSTGQSERPTEPRQFTPEEIAVKQAAAERGAELDLLRSQIALRDAINSGDGWDIAREGVGYISSLDDHNDAFLKDEGFLDKSEEAIFDGIEHAIGLGQAIDEGDGWEIAGNSIDLLRDIEGYMDANGGGVLESKGTGSGATALNIASSGFALAEAIEDGDVWGIASSTTSMIEGIDEYVGGGLGVDSEILSGVGSAIGLAANIASFEDVLESGDALNIAYTTASTINNAIGVYNAVALSGAVDGMSTFSGGFGTVGSIPVISIITAGIQLAQGDVRGASVTMAAAAAVAYIPVYGWAVAAVLVVANMIIGEDDPPSATADFSIDANGNIVMGVHGDSDMRESAEAVGSQLVAIIQNYKDMGGRVSIDDTLPSLFLEEGLDPQIRYTSEYGGEVLINVSNKSHLPLEMRGALYARDRGDRIDDAVKLASDLRGNIDFAKVDAALAAMGFTKQGNNYTYGESYAPRTGFIYGNGVFTGGGNANGPQGQHFVAKDSDIKSLPLTPDQRPSQTVGEILRSASLKHNFAGASGLLLAMGLGLDVDQACASALYGQVENPESNTDYSKPLDAVALASYLESGAESEDPLPRGSHEGNTIPVLGGSDDLQSILSSQLSGLDSNFSLLDENSDITAQGFGTTTPLAGTAHSNYPDWWDKLSMDTSFSPNEQYLPNQETTSALPTNNIQITETQLPPGFEAPPLTEGTAQGIYFSMAQDSSLRFLPTTLSRQSSDTYSSATESYTLLSHSNAQHGTVYEDANGDLRFAADEGFVGTASFEYTLLGPDGETIIRRALIVVEDLNDAPELNPDHFIINEGDSFYLDQLLNNDHDADGDSINVDHIRGLEHGTITEIDNRLLFTPDEGFTGTLNFSYMAHDGTYPQRAEASLTILDQNQGVVTTDDRFIILEDQPLLTTVTKLLANDHEYDGETIQLTDVHDAQHGQVSLDVNGNITFTPDPDYAGTEAGFSYTVADQSGNLTTAHAAIEVLDLREAPQVSSNTYPAINEDDTISFGPEEIAKFVSDTDGDQLHLDYITNIQHGTVIVENGFFTFIPEAGFSGTASFDYQANDNHRGTVQGHLDFEILPVNDAIVMGADNFQTMEETPLLVTVNELLANDLDPEGGAVTFLSVGEASHGTVSVDVNNNITFIPGSDYFGNEAGFNYTVRDDERLETTAFVQVEVFNSNDAPAMLSDTINTNEDQSITFDTATIERFLQDADGDSLTLSGISNITGGVISENNGLYTFSPDANYHGAASLDYSATDNNGGTVSGTLQIDILSVDDSTLFGADSLTTDEEVSVSTTVAELLANDSDVEGPLSFVALGAAYHGTVSIDAHGSITFTPEPDYFGPDAGFEYTVADADGNQASTMVEVNVAGVNDAPEIIGADITTNEDQAIVFDAATIEQFVQDRDGDSLTISAISNISGGVITEDNGLYTFTPDSDYHGDATLDYTADDGHGATVSGQLHIDILSVNDSTDFGDDTLNTDEETAVTTTVAELMANDFDGDGELTFIALGAALHGSLSQTENGDIIFNLDIDYSGSEAGFAYTVEDAEGNRESSMVEVHVANINDAPVILHDQRHIDEDQEIVFNQAEMASFIHDPDSDQLTFSSLSAVTSGSFSQDNGIYTFIPDADFYGTGQFAYTVSDGQGAEVSGTMTLHIAPVNDLPPVAPTTATMLEDGEIVFDTAVLMAGASDVEDGTDLRFMGISASSNGDGWVDDNGLLHFLPDDDFFGTATLSYSVADTEAGMGTGLITVTVLGENDAPLAMDDDHILAWSNNSYDNVYSSAVLLANDSDVDGDTIQISVLGNAEYGTVSQDVNGYIHYQAISNDWVGIDTFTYTITDGNGDESQATATIDVKLNTSPDAYSEILFTQEDIISIIDQETLLANDSDVDGDTLIITAVGNATHGTVSMRPDGKIEFTPELNFNNRYPGQASFEYTVSDGISDPVSAIAFVDLDPVNDAPVLVPERINGAIEDNSFEFTAAQLMVNDYDIEMASAYESDSISFAGVVGAAHGTLSYDSGTGIIYYNPDANFCGVETFQYQVTDSFGAISTGTSEIYVQPVNDNPVAQEDIASPAETLTWNKYSIADLVGNDFDVDGDSLTIVNPHVSSGSAIAEIRGGELWVQPSGGERYVEVSYTVSDGHGGTAPSRLIINQIVEHNYAPEVSIAHHRWDVNSSEGIYDVYFGVSVSDRNQGDTVTVSAAQVSGGWVTKNSNNSFDYTGALLYGIPSSFTLTAIDQQGASGTIYIQMWGGTEPGIGYKDYTFRYSYSPVILDLDGDGVELLGIEEGVTFDWNRDTIAESSGWVAADDGFLAYDYNHDGAVTRADELMLKEYLPGATTDLEGLQAFDTNSDGVFNNEDEAWSDFGVWQDKNSDGISDDGEFQTLDEAGITDIELESDGNEREIAGNTVFGSTVYHREDGSSGEVGDVALRGEEIVLTELPAEEESTEDPVDTAELQPIIEEELEQESSETQEITSADEGKTQTEPETELGMDEAEVNRLAQQLQSDAAAGSNTTGSSENVTEESIIIADSTDDDFQQPDDIEDDILALAA
jgi:VCBS repeat-containing protein